MIRALLLLVLLPSALLAQQGNNATTYYPSSVPIRDNGMDLDQDGVLGEVGVDDLACDGQGETETSNIATEQLDTDGTVERQIYVDLDTGTDNTTCGTTGSPCKTINYAGTTRGQATTASGDNMFICVQGSQNSAGFDIDDSDFDGNASHRVITASGRANSNQRWDKRIPDDPTVIMGWDTDNDNIYPPNDPDDEFLIDYTGDHILVTPANAPSYVEFAHFHSKEAGTANSQDNGFYDMNPGTIGAGRGSYWYMHDAKIEGVNREQCLWSGNIVFDWFSDQLQYFVLDRVHMPATYGYLARGGAGRPMHWMWENIYVERRAIGGPDTSLDNNGNSCVGVGGQATGNILFRIWYAGTVNDNTDFEFIDSTIIVDTGYGTNGYNNGTSNISAIDGGIRLSGIRDFNFSGNFVRDLYALPAHDPNDGIGTDHSSDDHHIDYNTLRYSHSGAVHSGVIYGLTGVLDQDAGGSGSDNVLAGEHTWNYNCFDIDIATENLDEGWYLLGSGTANFSAATFEIQGNAVSANWNGTRGIIWSSPNSTSQNTVPTSFVYKDNLFHNSGGSSTTDKAFNADKTDWSGAWDAGNGNNAYYTDDFADDGTSYSTLAAWQAHVTETSSTAGTNPTFPGCHMLSSGTDHSTGGGGGSNTLRLFLKVP